MNKRFHFGRGKVLATTAAVAILGTVVSVGVSAFADGGGDRSEHWGVITRNTIGSPVADLRSGPYGSFGVTGSAAAPPYGKGSLGIAVADKSTSLNPSSEKVTFGNEVDFFGDPVLALDAVGFHVFQTGENQSYGSRNMPNITFEIDANLTALPADNYTSMVWVPDEAPVFNRWSGFIDATTTGNWYFTGAEGPATTCTQALTCDFDDAMNALDDGGSTPVTFTAAIGKGRDNLWAGAVDGLRINRKVYDFEASPYGVKKRDARSHGGDDD